MRRRPLNGVRIPLPRQRGGVVESKKVYRRKPRTPKQLEQTIRDNGDGSMSVIWTEKKESK